MMFHCGTFRFDLSRPLVMGILNVTPDSFSDGGRYCDQAVDRAYQLIEQGADIIDIGGESTRPGAEPVGIRQELDRVLPVIEGLRGIAVPISIDTFKPEVMQAAVLAGASMINDINALQHGDALQIAAQHEVAVCLMHKQGDPQTMQARPEYLEVVAEVLEFLARRIAAAEQAGIARDRIAVDPGFCFGKSLDHNRVLLQRLHEFSALGVPVLAGLSRKSMLGAMTGRAVDDRMAASVAAALIAVQRGAAIVRVHDVAATVDALKIWEHVSKTL